MKRASAYFTLDSIDGKHDIKTLKKELDTIRGVISVSVSDTNDSVSVDFDTTGAKYEQIEKKIDKLGYSIKASAVQEFLM